MNREIKPKEIATIATLKNELGRILHSKNDLFRDLSSDEYYIILYFLLLQREGVLKPIVNNYGDEIRNKINNIADGCAEDKSVLFSFLQYELRLIINRISNEGIYQIVRILESLDQEVLKENFSEIFDDLLYKLLRLQGRYGGESILPPEMSRFVCALADLKPIDKPEVRSFDFVYNPFAGLASFGVFLPKDILYEGQEIHKTTWIIGKMRLMAHDREYSFGYKNENSVENWRNFNLAFRGQKHHENMEPFRFDLIISNPPFRMRLRNNISGHFGIIKNCEHFLLEKGIESLTADGKLIAVISQAFLVSLGSEQNLRQYLVESDLLETVISFPGGVLWNTGIPFAVLVLNKNKSKKGIVHFIDAKKFIDVSSSREKTLNDFALISLIKNNKESDIFRFISNQIIIDQKFYLNVPRYFQKQHDGIKLNELGNIIHGSRVMETQKSKFIRIRNLKDDLLDFQLETEKIVDEIPKQALKIEESCLLMALRWKTLKPTYFNYKGSPIFLSGDIIAFKIDESKVDVSYLINELHSEYAADQIESFKTGVIVPTIRRVDLLEIKIKLPDLYNQNKYTESLNEQKAKVEGLKEASVRMKLLEAERNALAHGLGNLVYENFASIKHSLGKPLLNIGSSLRNIEKALPDISKDWETIKLNKRLDVTLKDSFNSIYSSLEQVHSLLKNNERDLDVTNYSVSEVDFLKFIKSYIRKIKVSQKTNVQINLDINPDLIHLFDKKILINGNIDLIEIAFNNIVDNANIHAFIEPNQHYKLNINLSLEIVSPSKLGVEDTIGSGLPFLKIEFSNNGVPFPQNFTFEKFIRKNTFAGLTGNTGIGGYDINEIIKYHEGVFGLITREAINEFVTTYFILFPIIN